MLLVTACRSGYQGQESDHFDGNVFFNPWDRQDRTPWEVLRWKLTSNRQEWPEHVENKVPPSLAPLELQQGNLEITFINHASFLISLDGLNILTDPFWSERASPVSWAGPRRIRNAGVAFDNLPTIDTVLVSHNHYDHMDLNTLQRLAVRDGPQVLVPLGDKSWLKEDGIKNTRSMDWWQSHTLSPNVRIHFVPAQHWSARSLTDRNKSLWGGFVIEYRNKAVYIAGDTGYGPHFEMIASRFPNIEVALLPIGSYEPRWFMRFHHMNPKDAVQAFDDLATHYALGKHFGCLQLTDESLLAPLDALAKALENRADLQGRFIAPTHGTTYRFKL